LNDKLTAYLKSVNAQLPTKNPDYNLLDARNETRQRRQRTATRQRTTNQPNNRQQGRRIRQF
ncbi:MAG: hypothetical protein KAS23_11630, partial [Anaerohalosphaera sp.]|nr:hypothetical protein [Anaerohalosphaera sp.]